MGMLSDYLSHLIRLGGRLGFVHTVRDTDGGAVRVLDVGGVYQSATYLDERWASPVFNYYKSFDVVF